MNIIERTFRQIVDNAKLTEVVSMQYEEKKQEILRMFLLSVDYQLRCWKEKEAEEKK